LISLEISYNLLINPKIQLFILCANVLISVQLRYDSEIKALYEREMIDANPKSSSAFEAAAKWKRCPHVPSAPASPAPDPSPALDPAADAADRVHG
jgi:hypothetical protein